MEDQKTVKYCVCAMTDLLGFSSHLEISSYDLRTNIGEQAVTRLMNIENVLESIKLEKFKRKEYYPENLHIQRINDGVFFTMDLDDLLIPSVGNTNFQGLSANDIDKHFPTILDRPKEDFELAYKDKMDNIIEPITKFVGLISRFHLSLNKIETKSYFPGAKTVIATGFRRPFSTKDKGEDPFSANFAFSNAYLAESMLKGAKFYVDNSILQILSFNKYVNNILRFAYLDKDKTYFDSFENSKDVFYSSPSYNLAKPVDIKLFRKDFRFISLNAGTLAYLQSISLIMPLLQGKKEARLENVFYKNIFHAIQKGIEKNELEITPRTFLLNDSLDLDVDIGLILDFLENGKSLIKEDLANEKYQEETSNLTNEGKLKIKELMEKEVEIDLETIKIEDNLDFLFSLGENTLTALLLMIEGDLELLDFKKKDE